MSSPALENVFCLGKRGTIMESKQIRSKGGMRKEWIICPACGQKTRARIREDTVLINYPLYCPKCRQENLIQVEKLHINVIKEPDA